MQCQATAEFGSAFTSVHVFLAAVSIQQMFEYLLQSDPIFHKKCRDKLYGLEISESLNYSGEESR